MYIMNMMYAMYIKDTRIQGYENMMDIWGDVDGMMAMPCSTLGDETVVRPDEQDPTGRYNEYGMYGQADI